MSDPLSEIVEIVMGAIHWKCAEIERRPGVHDADAMWFSEEYARAVVSRLTAAGFAIVPREPTREMCDDGEDAIAEANRSVTLGVRCGCEKCDERAAEAVAKVWRAMVAALTPVERRE